MTAKKKFLNCVALMVASISLIVIAIMTIQSFLAKKALFSDDAHALRGNAPEAMLWLTETSVDLSNTSASSDAAVQQSTPIETDAPTAVITPDADIIGTSDTSTSQASSSPIANNSITYTTPGLYKYGTNTLLMSWEELIDEGVLVISNGVVKVIPGKKATLSGHLVLGTEVTIIGVRTFEGCTKLQGIQIPDSVVKIKKDAFFGCEQLIQTENGVNYVDQWVVSTTGNIQTAVLRADTVGIAEYAFNTTFEDNTTLTGVTIPENVKTIGNYAFRDCTKLTEIHFNATNMKDADTARMAFYNVGRDSDGVTVYIGADVEKIPNWLFGDTTSHAPKLTAVVFAENSACTSIGDHAFANCVHLTSIEIPSGVTTLGAYAFKNCTRLTEIHFNATSMADLTNESNAFYNAGRVGGGITVTVGANVERIPAYLFEGTIYYIPQITTVVFEEGSVCESIGDLAFYLCDQLESIVLPAGITTIGEYAFCNCKSLVSITIPASVTAIDEGAFCNDCTLTNITFLGTMEQWNAIEFDSKWEQNTSDYTIVCDNGDILKVM